MGDYKGQGAGHGRGGLPVLHARCSATRVNDTGREESIKVKDVAELVAESMGPPTGS